MINLSVRICSSTFPKGGIMISDPSQLERYSESDLSVPLIIAITLPTYKQAFLEGVWKENLSDEEITRRLTKNFSGDFKGYWYVDHDGLLACTSWYQFVDLSFIRQEKGDQLADFSQQILTNFDTSIIVWHAETITHPLYWRQGLAKQAKQQVMRDLDQFSRLHNSVLVLTRMRDDNRSIIAINQELGMKRTGIRMFCTTDPGNPEKMHEYWYKILPF